ncbi:MAG: protein-L-isoaspartate O-methyltransferase [Rhodobacteraceae bacterium]|nr:protein-L-isoaspartate O-methyltransferase [Paracoccaceae bacterium]
MTDFAALRTAMVDCQVRPSDVTKYPVIEAMLAVRREAFVPRARREVAYAGGDINLGAGRVVLDPRVFAKMLDTLNVRPDELVLVVGAGLGYEAAVIARMAEAVIALESDETLAADAETNLTDESVDNAVTVTGDLAEGSARHGPYDAIICIGAVEDVPAALLEQLKNGGRIVAIFALGAAGQCRIGTKTAGKVAWRNVFNATAPVLPGFAKAAAFAL